MALNAQGSHARQRKKLQGRLKHSSWSKILAASPYERPQAGQNVFGGPVIVLRSLVLLDAGSEKHARRGAGPEEPPTIIGGRLANATLWDPPVLLPGTQATMVRGRAPPPQRLVAT